MEILTPGSWTHPNNAMTMHHTQDAALHGFQNSAASLFLQLETIWCSCQLLYKVDVCLQTLLSDGHSKVHNLITHELHVRVRNDYTNQH